MAKFALAAGEATLAPPTEPRKIWTDMEYLALGLAGLLGGTYVICSAAEFLLWLFEREPPQNSYVRRARPSVQDEVTSLRAEKLRPPARSGQNAVADQKRGILIAAYWFLHRKLFEMRFRDGSPSRSVTDAAPEPAELPRMHIGNIDLESGFPLDVHPARQERHGVPDSHY